MRVRARTSTEPASTGQRAGPAQVTKANFLAPSDEVARWMIGATLLLNGVGGRIVETEAYDRDDPASHSFTGPTTRNATMFGPPGHVYVYRSYGIHWCFNIVCREPGHGAGVLIRALEPVAGIDVMASRRGLSPGTGLDTRLLCSGPGRVGQALAIDLGYDGMPVDKAPFQFLLPAAEPLVVLAAPRIGISKAVDRHWRFGLAGSRFLSRPFRRIEGDVP